jgi:hypothetical protein
MATGKYTFIPWLKEGLSLSNEVVDQLGENTPTGISRGYLSAVLKYTADTTEHSLDARTFNLFGPGDVMGVKNESIINKYPSPNAVTAEPNYLPYIEFYDEDFPWRYTPAIAHSGSTQRLTPWLALIALKASEFDDQSNYPLPAIKVKDAGTGIPLPQDPAKELWAWAHVQISDIVDNTSDSTFAESIEEVRANNPDAIISRIMAARKSEPNTTYHLFLVPTFENGRLAGLGLDPVADVLTMAWGTTEVILPYYQRWSYATSENEDFESLVDELAPIVMDPQAGVRYFDFRTVENAFENSLDYDILNPANSVTTTDKWGLMGALKSPSTAVADWTDAAQKLTFEEELRAYLNKGEERLNIVDNAEAHPVVLPPIYGKWHAKVTEVAAPPYEGWIKDVNLDLGNRATAGMGTDIIIENQENFMKHAWEQVGEIIKANQALNLALMAKEIGKCYHNRHIQPLTKEKLLKVSKGVAKRTIPQGESSTVFKQMNESNLPNGNIERAFNKITRTKNRVTQVTLSKAGILAGAQGAKSFYNNLATDLNDLSKPLITTAVKKDFLATNFLSAPEQLIIFNDLQLAESTGTSKTYYVVQAQEPDAPVWEDLNGLPYDAEEDRPELDINAVHTNVLEATEPKKVIKDLYGNMISQVGQPVAAVETLDQIQAAPHFRWPMYEHLVKISTDLMFPGLDQIPDNSVTLLETNNVFIQSFMLGLNHEMSRELLWREYPTDQRGTYFKQFWDSVDHVDDQGKTIFTEEAVEETRQDISDIHGWNKAFNIGSASFAGDGSIATTTVENDMVLVVRGEVLRRYPNTVIYAQKAAPRVGNNARQLADDSDPLNIKFPIFSAKINDIVLLGFDLTATDVSEGDGWYFVFRERPGQTRFGMDIERDGEIGTGNAAETIADWNDLSWSEALNSPGFLSASGVLNPRTGIADAAGIDYGTSGNDYWPNESGATFLHTSSAEIGHALYQSPVMVAVHATKMLANIN